jgi:hypothetical protein
VERRCCFPLIGRMGKGERRGRGGGARSVGGRHNVHEARWGLVRWRREGRGRGEAARGSAWRLHGAVVEAEGRGAARNDGTAGEAARPWGGRGRPEVGDDLRVGPACQ